MATRTKQDISKSEKLSKSMVGNTNAIRHGLKSGKLPLEAKYVEIRLNIIRRNIEEAVLAAKGSVSLVDAALIQTALRWERHSCLAQRWLTKEYKKLSTADKLNFSREIARASVERDKALADLDLDVDPVSPWAQLTDATVPDLEDKTDD